MRLHFKWLYRCSFVLGCRAWKPIIIDRYLSFQMYNEGVSQLIWTDCHGVRWRCVCVCAFCCGLPQRRPQSRSALIADPILDTEINVLFYTDKLSTTQKKRTQAAFPAQMIKLFGWIVSLIKRFDKGWIMQFLSSFSSIFDLGKINGIDDSFGCCCCFWHRWPIVWHIICL